MSLRRRVVALGGVFVAGLVLIAATAVMTVRERDAALTDLQQRIDPAREGVNAMLNAMIDQESGVRGFLLTGEEALLEPYTSGRAAMTRAVGDLDRLIGDDPGLGPLLDRAEAAARAWQRDAAEPELELTAAGRAQDAAVLVLLGQDRFDGFRAAVADLRDAVTSAERVAEARADEARTAVTRLLIAVVVLSAALAALTALLLRRWVLVPLRTISAAVHEVTAGQRHRSIPVVGPPELAAHAADVEAMRARTVALLDEALAAREALAQQAPAVATLRAELRPVGSVPPDGLEVAGTLLPAAGVLAGDWYDWTRTADGRVVAVVVDVAGHGTAAGIDALRVKHLLPAALAEAGEPGDVIAWLARHLPETDESFLTCLLLDVDPATGLVRWANAGHPAALLVDGGRVEELGPTGPLLGPLAGTWATRWTDLPPGGTVVAVTDGAVEARDPAGVQFGEDRLRDLAVAASGTAAERAAAIADAVRDHAGGRIADDLTVLAIRRT